MCRMCWSSLVLVLLVPCCLCTQNQYSYMDYPNSLQEKEKCGRQDTGRPIYVCDPNNLLKEDDAATLDVAIESVMNETDCRCSTNVCEHSESPGYRISVALVKKLKLPAPNKSDDNAATSLQVAMAEASFFANTMLHNWKIGRCGDDVHIFYSLYDGVIYTVVGDVTFKVLSPYTIAEILQLRRMELRQDVYIGLLQIVSDYKAVFLGKYQPMKRQDTPPKFDAVRGSGTKLSQLFFGPFIMMITLMLSH